MSIKDSIFSAFTKNKTVSQEIIGVSFIEEASNSKTVSDDDLQKMGSSNQKKFYEHPCDYKLLRDTYKNHALINSMINKLVDNVIGPGFSVKSEDERIELLLNNHVRDTNLQLRLKSAFSEAFITGFGTLEVFSKNNAVIGYKPVNSATLFKKRGDDGGFVQVLSNSESKDFLESEIIEFSVNKLPGATYGFGLIYPLLKTLDNYVSAEKDMHTLIHRKANSITHWKLGSAEQKIIPSQASVDAFGAKLHNLTAKTDITTDPYVESKVLEFGNIGEKFSFVLEHDLLLLTYGMQIPEVIMGKGSIPEGLAGVQLDIFDRAIQSFRNEFEEVVETRIFSKVLEVNGIAGPFELVWDSTSRKAAMDEVVKITELLKLFDLDINLRMALEERIAELLNVDFKSSEFSAREKQAELNRKQPLLPGQNAMPPKKTMEAETVFENVPFKDEDLPINFEDMTLKEWTGYNFSAHQEFIETFLDSPDFNEREFTGFEYVPGSNNQEWRDLVIRYKLTDNLSREQVSALRIVLKNGFRNNLTMREIIKGVQNKVRPEDLIVKVDAVRDVDGTLLRRGYEMTIPSRVRSSMIGRTETIRSSNAGALAHYESDGVSRASWLAARSERTCGFCDGQNGKVMEIVEARERIPAHSNCRCTWIPILTKS